MNDDYLYQQLFNDPPPKKVYSKESNVDVLNSLFAVQLPTTNKTPAQIEKKKSEEEANYLSRMVVKSKDKNQANLNRLRD